MEVVFLLLFVLICLIAAHQQYQTNKHRRSLQEELKSNHESLSGALAQVEALEARIGNLSRFESIVDVEGEIKRMQSEAGSEARQLLATAQAEALRLRSEADQLLAETKASVSMARSDADQKAKQKVEDADRQRISAYAQAEAIIQRANEQAKEIAGDALIAVQQAKQLTETAKAMRNIIEGYGHAYIVPSYSVLDNLAEEFGFAEAGLKLKEARENTRSMVKIGRAAACDYAEANRKTTAIRFVADAFNGKVDSILSRIKGDNIGKLEREIRDAFALVNTNGAAFRNARITDEYLASRLEELRWGVTANLLKEQAREEQRQLREQMREEEKARREYERAIKEAAKEEEAIRKAMERMHAQVAQASEAQKAEFQAKLSELEGKLAAAEEKNQRALSMAQQTRSGHVYVISNIGSFGEEVFKIGMTRRLEPIDRVKELGDASVPFEFDIHALIHSDDAPALEKTLHKHFLLSQVNKVNPRKEFFRLSLPMIRSEIERLGIQANWTMSAAANEFRESQEIERRLLVDPQLQQEWSRHQEAEVDSLEFAE
jgi:chromosome segregation ATPase